MTSLKVSATPVSATVERGNSMAYVDKVTVKGHTYYRLVESYREAGKVKHRILRNYGSTPPDQVGATPVSATPRKDVGSTPRKGVSATPIATTVDVQIALQTRARDHGITPELYLERLFRMKDPLIPHHGRRQSDGKRY